ncbi:MAG TPA: prephenate dehydratase [Bacteroidota bacterium]|nr:prephenate dehydratase [Bacteroidota bacterium]
MKKNLAAYQGEPGAFSEQAVRTFFGSKAIPQPQPTFGDAFSFAEKHKNAFAIVPIENSVYGSIHQVYDLLLKHPLFIVGEVKLRIEMQLMALPGIRMKDIKTIYSQVQALGQCESFLSTLPDVRIEAFHDTAAAAKLIKDEKRRDAAAIASAFAAKKYGLHILKRNVESDHQNFTRFIVLSRKQKLPEQDGKTSLVFAVKDIPGALFKALAVFALRDINLLKIESRPYRGKPWQYLFYLDVQGRADSSPLTEAIRNLEEVSAFVKILGSYQPHRDKK